MCRVLAYLGPRVPLADLLLQPRNSLINQSFDSEYHGLMQLAGTGFASWEAGSVQESEPLIYRNAKPAFFDRNLHSLANKLTTTNLLAHVRATSYRETALVHDDNCHPFRYEGFRLALAHNGGLPGWRDMLHEIMALSRPEIIAQHKGSTDTEALYALLMSQFEDPTADMRPDEIIDGLSRFMTEIRALKRRRGNSHPAKLKFFLADGNDLVAANMGLGFDDQRDIPQSYEQLRQASPGSRERTLAGIVEPLWFQAGKNYGLQGDHYGMSTIDAQQADAVVVASEHLTDSPKDWTPVPLGHVVFFKRHPKGCSVRLERLDY
jgi:glutamine amidotransferase